MTQWHNDQNQFHTRFRLESALLVCDQGYFVSEAVQAI